MKKILYSILCIAAPMLLFSCTEIDNYPAPKETFYGNIIDKETGENMPTDWTHDNGTRIKLMEYSWSENPSPFYFAVSGDGSFMQSKIFKGTYGVTVFGPFVPIPSIELEIKGKVKQDFIVEPFLRFTWVGTPVVNADRSVTLQFKVVRGTTNPDYQQKLKRVKLYGGINQFTSEKDGNVGEYEKNLGDDLGNDMLDGRTVSVTSPRIPVGRNTAFFRMGGNIDKSIEGQIRFNYSTVVRVDLP